MNVHQKTQVTKNHIKQAPILQLQSKMNVKCEAGQIQELKCCVQSPYRVKWFQNSVVLSSSKYEGMSENPHCENAEKWEQFHPTSEPVYLNTIAVKCLQL